MNKMMNDILDFEKRRSTKEGDSKLDEVNNDYNKKWEQLNKLYTQSKTVDKEGNDINQSDLVPKQFSKDN